MELQETYKDLLPPPPRIVDPANPANNLYESGIRKRKVIPKEENDWTPFAKEVANLNIGPDIMKEHEEYVKQK